MVSVSGRLFWADLRVLLLKPANEFSLKLLIDGRIRVHFDIMLFEEE